jgi:hypothetical protein
MFPAQPPSAEHLRRSRRIPRPVDHPLDAALTIILAHSTQGCWLQYASRPRCSRQTRRLDDGVLIGVHRVAQFVVGTRGDVQLRRRNSPRSTNVLTTAGAPLYRWSCCACPHDSPRRIALRLIAACPRGDDLSHLHEALIPLVTVPSPKRSLVLPVGLGSDVDAFPGEDVGANVPPGALHSGNGRARPGNCPRPDTGGSAARVPSGRGRARSRPRRWAGFTAFHRTAPVVSPQRGTPKLAQRVQIVQVRGSEACPARCVEIRRELAQGMVKSVDGGDQRSSSSAARSMTNWMSPTRPGGLV